MKRTYRGTVAILTGGGDTCALNRSIETIKNVAYLLDYRVLGIYAGWKGLLGDGFVVDISEQSINGHIGGSILGSSRTNPYKEGQNRVDEVLSNIKRYGIDIIISIGGDDTESLSSDFPRPSIMKSRRRPCTISGTESPSKPPSVPASPPLQETSSNSRPLCAPRP